MKIVKEYDLKIDAKNRLTLKSPLSRYFHVKKYTDGSYHLSPMVLVEPTNKKRSKR